MFPHRQVQTPPASLQQRREADSGSCYRARLEVWGSLRSLLLHLLLLHRRRGLQESDDEQGQESHGGLEVFCQTNKNFTRKYLNISENI